MWFQVTHLPQKGTCFRKLTNITFAYLLSPTILQHFKQILIQGCIILAQIARFSRDVFSGKTDYYFSVFVVFYIATPLKNLREQIIRQSCIILAQIGLGPVHQKGIYWKSWPTLHWSFISHHATYFQNNPETADHTVA